MGKLIVLSLFTFVGCKEGKKNTGQAVVVNAEHIKSIEVVAAGGEMGFYSSILMDKDSIHYQRTIAVNEAENLKYSKRTKPEDWKNLVGKINLDAFKMVKEGRSIQPVDGVDTKIIITNDKENVSKMNAQDNPVWQNVLDDVHQCNGEYK